MGKQRSRVPAQESPTMGDGAYPRRRLIVAVLWDQQPVSVKRRAPLCEVVMRQVRPAPDTQCAEQNR